MPFAAENMVIDYTGRKQSPLKHRIDATAKPYKKNRNNYFGVSNPIIGTT